MTRTRQLLLGCFCFMQNFLFAGDPSTKDVTSKINNVTVFLQGAQVSRQGAVDLSVGNTTLKFAGLSPKLLANSIQVKAENGNVTILSVIHQLNYTQEQQKSEEIKTLEADRLIWQGKIERNAKAQQVVKSENDLVMLNRSIGGNKDGVDLAELKLMADFFRSRITELMDLQLALQNELVQFNKEISKIDQQLAVLRAVRDLATSEIFVNVTSKLASKANFTLSYTVQEASWTPAYDLRVESISKPVNLTYKANVTQLSGEDWKDVNLTLSTGNPYEGGSKPNWQMWRLDFYHPPVVYDYRDKDKGRISGGTDGARGYIDISGNTVSGAINDENGEPVIGASIAAKGSSLGAYTDIDGHFSFTIPTGTSVPSFMINYIGYGPAEVANTQGRQSFMLALETTMLESVVIVSAKNTRGKKMKKKRVADAIDDEEDEEEDAYVPVTVNVGVTSVDFVIETPYTVLTDGKNYSVDIKEHTLPAQYEYYCAPKLDLSAFLTAKVTNWESFNLLSGKANIYFEGTYLGESYLDVTTKDTLELSLGRDKNIVISREKKADFSKKQILGSNKHETRTFEISVRNKKPQAVNIIIEDQFPVPSTNEIKLEDLNKADAMYNTETGKLTWKLSLPPSQEKKWTFGYTVKYPKNKNVLLE